MYTAERRGHLAESSELVERRRHGTMKFAVGIVVQQVTTGVSGVISSWDLSCDKSDEWMEEMGICNLPRGRNQPCYRLYCQNNRTLYVAEGD